MPDFTDPRRLGGDISGPGGPYDRDQVVVDSRGAVLHDHTTCAAITEGLRGQEAYGVVLEGRINQSRERARVLFLSPLEGLAAIVTEITGVVERNGDGRRFARMLERRADESP